jgi:hypothetical protein
MYDYFFGLHVTRGPNKKLIFNNMIIVPHVIFQNSTCAKYVSLIGTLNELYY